MKAVVAALTPPADPGRLRIVCVMTDGYVGNDMQIIDSVKKHIGSARLFSFGVGNGVNRYLLDKMAEMGRGEVEYVTLNRHGDEVAEAFQRKIGTPLLTNISIDWANLPVKDVFPEQNPDLFSGKPLIITGRYSHAANGTITLRGERAGEPYARKIEIRLPEKEPSHDVLGSLWARTCIENLMDRDLEGIQQGTPSKKIKEQITDLGLKFRLMTQFTSFVAVEEKVVTEGGVPKTVVVPVEMPEGVSYEGVFGDKDETKTAARTRANAPGQITGFSTPSSSGGNAVCKSKAPSKLAMEEDRSYHQEHAKKPEEKLDPALAGLAEKVRAEGSNGNLTKGDIRVKNGRIRLILTVTHVSGKVLEELKKKGFTINTYSASGRVITGTVSVEGIKKIAECAFVDKIEPLTAEAQAMK
jgi:Ca-activated chloride channel family protein